MNKSIGIKFIMTALVVILISCIFYSSSSYAMGEVISGGKDFLSAGSTATTVIKQDQLKSTSNYIYNTLLAVAIVVAVIVAMILGIQFMWASADEKAKVKEALMPFVVGCIVVFGSFTIWKVAVNIGNRAEGIIDIEDGDKLDELYDEVKNGTVDINNLSDRDLRLMYAHANIPRTIGELARDNNCSIEEAINIFLNTTNYSDSIVDVYIECKERGLLNQNGITLNN